MEETWSNTLSIKLDEQDILGRGCEGTIVYRGHFGSQPVAVKQILITNNLLVERELEALQDCCHHRLLRLLHFERDNQFLRLALELCAASLEDYCKGRYHGAIPRENDALKQMLEGLAFIHSCNYVHRDVKPSNILISMSGDLKIADFGLCKSVAGYQFSLSTAAVGTVGWMAPELLQNINNAENGLPKDATTAIDVFALGCVFYYFLTKGTHPFGNDILRNANILSKNYDLSKLKKKFIYRSAIKQMISHNPAQRPKLEELLKDPIFNLTNLDSKELLRDKRQFKNFFEKLFSRNIKVEMTITNQANNSPSLPHAEIYQDECDSNDNQEESKQLDLQKSSFRMPRIPERKFLQVVNEEPCMDSLSPLKSTSSRPRAFTGLTAPRHREDTGLSIRRSGVSSAPLPWQRTLPSRRQVDKTFVMSRYHADGGDGYPEAIGSPWLRSVTSLTNIDASEVEYSENSASTFSLASSTTAQSGSMISLARSFIEDIFHKPSQLS